MTIHRIILTLSITGLLALPVRAQQPSSHVTLNFPPNTEVRTLADYIAKRLNLNFIFDEQVSAKRITLSSSMQIPVEGLLPLLESALRIKGLTMSKTDVPGLLRISLSNQLTAVSRGLNEDPDPHQMAVTRVFELKHASAKRVEQVTNPFLSGPMSNLIPLADLDLVIVTDYASNIARIEQLVTLVDQPGRDILVRFINVEHVKADDLAKKVTSLLTNQSKARGTATSITTAMADERTNQVVVIGPVTEVEEAVKLVESLDIPLGLDTKVYTLNVASPDQLDRIIRNLIGDVAVDRLYQSATEPDANLLVVTATQEIHQKIDDLREQLDKPREESQSPVRFYKLENANAAEVLKTLQSIEGRQGIEDVTIDGVSADLEEVSRPRSGRTDEPAIRGRTSQTANPTHGSTSIDTNEPLTLSDARVMADEATNTIIVVAVPSVQAIYERLIKRLDIRRPQVLVEATVVIIDTTDGFELGVELSSTNAGVDGGVSLNFTQFGLSMANPATGALTLSPGTGFNGALLGADVAQAVIRALEKDTRARVVSRPSVLVNDNAIGTLTSESEEPYASVNASQTVATTSFAGFASAGTSIDITPTISEGEYLKLKYSISLSSFTDAGTDELPPSRKTNSLSSEATIPDGHTIVVGGLSQENKTDSVNRVPILGSVPVLEYLFSNRSETTTQSTMFVFIRAVVLRDDKFQDLKVISADAADRVNLPQEFPASEPIEMR